MAKVKVEVLDAVVDGHKKGAQIDIEEKSANYLEKIGYVKKVATSTKSSGKTSK